MNLCAGPLTPVQARLVIGTTTGAGTVSVSMTMTMTMTVTMTVTDIGAHAGMNRQRAFGLDRFER